MSNLTKNIEDWLNNGKALERIESLTKASNYNNTNNNKNINNNNNESNEDFEKFWNMYDLKKDKPKCIKKWNKLSKEDIKKIFDTLPDYIKSKPDKQYRGYPLTYLNGERWNDEIIMTKDNLTLQQKLNAGLVKHKNDDGTVDF